MKTLRISTLLALLLFCCMLCGVSAQEEVVPAEGIMWGQSSSELFMLNSSELIRIPLPDMDPRLHLTVENSAVKILDYSPVSDLALISSADQHSVVFYRMSDGKVITGLQLGAPAVSTDFSKDGYFMLGAGDEIKAVIFDPDLGEVVTEVRGFDTAAPIYDCRFSPDGQNVIWHSRASVAVENIADQIMLGPTMQFQDFIDVFALSEDNNTLAAVLPGPNNLYEVVFNSVVSGQETGRTELGSDPIVGVQFSKDGSYLFAADKTTLYVINTLDYSVVTKDTMAEEALEDAGKEIRRISLAPDGSVLAILQGAETIHLVSFEQEQTVEEAAATTAE